MMDLISVTRRGGSAFDVHVRHHAVTSDMSPQDGGQDTGFAPVELFAGSLAACIAMMVQGYCDRCEHGAGGDVGVSLTVELADDPKRISAIVADVELPDGFPENRREAVRRVAEQCVIHESLKHPPRVDLDFL
jgi:putative redox protein